MIGKVSIEFGLSNICDAWLAFRKGKAISPEMHEFQYNLEENLYELYEDLNTGKYKHSGYRQFTVCDNKKRDILVSSIRDRVVHRLIYNALLPAFDKTFIYDVWSCRPGKGLLACIRRTQYFLKKYPRHFVWRADLKKFFDNVDHEVLMRLLQRKVSEERSIWLLREVVGSYCSKDSSKGMPIGNLTSQIFANIYLNELDRFIKHTLRVKAYLRYGDDFILFEKNRVILESFRIRVISFLTMQLCAQINPKNDVIVKAKQGLKFLGVEAWPSGIRLKERSQKRIIVRLSLSNIASYFGMLRQYEPKRKLREFEWQVGELETLEPNIRLFGRLNSFIINTR